MNLENLRRLIRRVPEVVGIVRGEHPDRRAAGRRAAGLSPCPFHGARVSGRAGHFAACAGAAPSGRERSVLTIVEYTFGLSVQFSGPTLRGPAGKGTATSAASVHRRCTVRRPLEFRGPSCPTRNGGLRGNQLVYIGQ